MRRRRTLSSRMRWAWSSTRLRMRSVLGVTSSSSSPAEIQAILPGSSCAEESAAGVVAAGRRIICNVLFTYVDGQIVRLGRDADHHAGVDRRAGIYEQRAALLRCTGRRRRLRPFQKRSANRWHAAVVHPHRAYTREKIVLRMPSPVGVGKKIAAVAEQAGGGNEELQPNTVALRAHLQQFAFAPAHFFP